MADPFTMIALAVGSTAMNALGSIRQGQEQQAAANYNAAVADQNAKIAQDQAARAEADQRRQAEKLAGEQVAAYAASGVTEEGSPLKVMYQSAQEAEMDALNIRYQGYLNARQQTAEADLQRYQGRAALQAGYIGALGELFKGGSKVYGLT